MCTFVRDETKRKSEHFANFRGLYLDALDQFTHIVKTLDSGLVFQPNLLLCLRDNLFGYLENDSQIIDYLYRMPATDTQMTYTHCFNAGLLCYCFGKWCHLDSKTLDEFTLAGFLYDCGLCKIDKSVLEKTEPLDFKERMYINKHVSFSYELLKSQNIPKISKLILTHHEKKDGSGYPLRLYGNQINSYSSILSLADQFEALTHVRSYRYALHPLAAIDFIEQCGLDKFTYITASSLLIRIATTYIGNDVFLSDGSIGRIIGIHDKAIGRPIISIPGSTIDLKERNDLNIVFM